MNSQSLVHLADAPDMLSGHAPRRRIVGKQRVLSDIP